MLALLFLIIVGVGLFTAYRLLWPEMYLKLRKPELDFIWKRPKLRDDVVNLPQFIVDAPIRDDVYNQAPTKEKNISMSGMDKINKLEALLLEKNKVIDRLQTQLDNERSTRKEFDNVKAIMDEEIKHLREQLKAFRNYYKEKADA